VSPAELTPKQRAVLFALLGEARQVANPELKNLIGIGLDGADRRGLNDRRLVESTRVGRAYAHELTDAGWRWCDAELAAAPGGRASSLERAHYRVFGLFARYLDAAGLSLADLVRPGDPAAPIEAGYRSLAARPGAFVRLRDLRERLSDQPRPQLDAALAALFAAQRVNLVPQSNQQALTAADRAAALRVGGEDKHLISID
jgi:hypothetical protein